MTIPKSRMPTSTGVSRRRPAIRPNDTPTTTATIIAAVVSSNVAAPFSTITLVTGRLSVIVWPKSSRTTSPR